MKSSTGKNQGQAGRRRASTAEQKFPEDHGKPMLEEVYPEELESMKSTHRGAWNSVRRKEQLGGSLTALYLLQPLLCNSGGIEESGLKELVWTLEWRLGELFH